MNIRWISIWAMIVFATPRARPADIRKQLGEVEFFGHKNFDLTAVLAVLPFHEGDLFPPAKADSTDELKRQVKERIKQATGREPTGVWFVCCDAKERWMAHNGLPGESYQALAFHPNPAGDIRLPKAALALRQQFEKSLLKALMKGVAAQDGGASYTLTNDPAARKAELAIREYALQNETLIFQVLAFSANARHRAIAAQMVGYGRQSDEPIDALVRASLDPDDEVRSDAVRALGVLASAK